MAGLVIVVKVERGRARRVSRSRKGWRKGVARLPGNDVRRVARIRFAFARNAELADKEARGSMEVEELALLG